MTTPLRIGILSDTHGYFDPTLPHHLEPCDEIWHAGDIGSTEVAERLAACKPLRAVHGNIDDAELRQRYPRDLRFQIEGLQVWITHIAGRPPHYTRYIQEGLRTQCPSLLVAGHSHILALLPDPKRPGMLFLNPGAAGQQGQHATRTLVRLTLHKGTPSQLEVIELGPRGKEPATP